MKPLPASVLEAELSPDPAFLVESLTDLQLITGTAENHNNTWASLLEAPSVFDLCRYTEDGR